MNNRELIEILRAKAQELEKEKSRSKYALENCEYYESQVYNSLLLAEKNLMEHPSEKIEKIYWKRYEAWNNAQKIKQVAEETYDCFCESLDTIREACHALEKLRNISL